MKRAYLSFKERVSCLGLFLGNQFSDFLYCFFELDLDIFLEEEDVGGSLKIEGYKDYERVFAMAKVVEIFKDRIRSRSHAAPCFKVDYKLLDWKVILELEH